MDFNNVYIGLAVVGVVKFIDLVADSDYRSASKIVAATAVGALIGHYVDYASLDAFKGGLSGLVGSGIVTVASYRGSKSAVQVDQANIIKTESINEGTKVSSRTK